MARKNAVRGLTHAGPGGAARMVDVGAKPATRRQAEATAFVELSQEVLAALPRNPKGGVLEIARLAGIMAAKRTGELIPLCHSLPLEWVDVEIEQKKNGVRARAHAATKAQTGVEMEAMVAAAVAALTIYDMCKGLDKDIVVRDVRLEKKSGGKSGDWRRSRGSGLGTRD